MPKKIADVGRPNIDRVAQRLVGMRRHQMLDAQRAQLFGGLARGGVARLVGRFVDAVVNRFVERLGGAQFFQRDLKFGVVEAAARARSARADRADKFRRAANSNRPANRRR